MDTDDRHARYQRFIDRVEIPMLVLSVLLIPVVVMPFVEDLSPWSTTVLWWTGAVIWVGFAVQYGVLLYLSPHRWHTVRTNKLDLLLVLLPVLRPVRLLRIVRLARAGTAFARVAVAARRVFGRPGFASTILTVLGFIVVGGLLVAVAEHGQVDSTIGGLGDGLWWALVTCTTVGYGDEFPVTGSGRAIAVILMVVGISGLSVVTANIAAYFVSTDADDDTRDLDRRLDRIEAQLERLTANLVDGPASSGSQVGDPIE